MPSILLLHGVQSSRRTWWRIQEDLVDLGWQVTALDLPGHGEHPAGAAPLTVASMAADVAARLEGPVDLVAGHSLGAVVALELVHAHPRLARGVVLEDPPGLGADLDPADVADEVLQESPLARTDPDGLRERTLRDEPRWSRRDAEHAVESRQRLDEHAVAAMLRCDPWDLPALVRHCPLPIELLVADSSGSALTGAVRAELVAAVPPERVALVRSGHGIHRERPALWLHAVLGFAADLPAGGTR